MMSNSKGWLELKVYIPKLGWEKKVAEKILNGRGADKWDSLGKTWEFLGEHMGNKKVCFSTGYK
jgi:hypothetical protein